LIEDPVDQLSKINQRAGDPEFAAITEVIDAVLQSLTGCATVMLGHT
jgi:hypothetical protein